MSRPDDLGGEMHRGPFDDRTVDRLLDGRLNTDDVPLELAPVVGLVTAARGPAGAGELDEQTRIVAAMAGTLAGHAEAATEVMAGARVGGRARSRVARILTAKVVAITLTTVVGVTGAAAATGSLPTPAQTEVASALSHVGWGVPRPAPHAAAHPAAAGATRRTTHAARPAAVDETTDPATDVASTDPGPADTTPADNSSDGGNGAGTDLTTTTLRPVDPTLAARLALCLAARVPDDTATVDGADPTAVRHLADAATAAGVDVATFCAPGALRSTPATTAAVSRLVDLNNTTTTSIRSGDGRIGIIPTTTTDPSSVSTTTTAATGGDRKASTTTSVTSNQVPSTTTSTSPPSTPSAATSTSSTMKPTTTTTARSS